jgi:hypothetical protein
VICNHRKKVAVVYQQITMANSPVDRNPELMQQEFGTKVLITDLAADRLLEKAAKFGTERYSRWCGGKDGFDDYAERLH